ncbi:hypothetical protein PanWU01x14_114900 [Parasponia andersonii]|uniref:Transmembrane protein n=1 Tax=Parasponia andersonii TaxID=3476 RepID=A0A2P5CXJ7_PARAD|nr:hypothetical protein PanWU01x14_114900 [Parasponia andersonii]
MASFLLRMNASDFSLMFTATSKRGLTCLCLTGRFGNFTSSASTTGLKFSLLLLPLLLLLLLLLIPTLTLFPFIFLTLSSSSKLDTVLLLLLSLLLPTNIFLSSLRSCIWAGARVQEPKSSVSL